MPIISTFNNINVNYGELKLPCVVISVKVGVNLSIFSQHEFFRALCCSTGCLPQNVKFVGIHLLFRVSPDLALSHPLFYIPIHHSAKLRVLFFFFPTNNNLKNAKSSYIYFCRTILILSFDDLCFRTDFSNS